MVEIIREGEREKESQVDVTAKKKERNNLRNHSAYISIGTDEPKKKGFFLRKF